MAANFMQRTIDTFHAQQGLGIPPWGDYLLLLTARGAKSGEAHTTPAVYRRRGDDLVIVASKGGFPGGHPQWYLNLLANPEAEVEVAAEGGGTERLRVKARAVPSGPERDELYAFMTEVWPGFADYQAKTDRTIPVVVLTPL